jgi:cytosine/adenosine deaminase-related metal-dependent hydrolase
MNTPEHTDAAIAALQSSRSRAVFAYGNSNRGWIPMSDEPHSHDVERIQRQYFNSGDQLLTLALAVRGPEYTTLEVTEHDYNLARRLGLRISIHAGSGLEGHRFRPVIKLRDLGLLGSDVTYIHANTLTDEEFRLLADTGGTVSMSPEIEMHMGHGIPCTGKLLAVGVRPSLSIDVVTTVGGSMFGAMRAALAAERCRLHMAAWERGESLTELPLTAREVLEFATIEGARACGLDHHIGTLTPGKDADIVLIASKSFGMLPLNDPVGAVVTQAQPSDVDSVFVAGRPVKRDGRMVGIDDSAVARMVTESRDYLYSRAGVPAGGQWIDHAPMNVAAGPPLED